MSRVIIEVKDLRIERDDTVLVDAVDFRVERGEHWVILGPNGCGKTSVLRALAGYLPGRGELSVLGHRFGSYDWRELRTRIGLVSHSLLASIPAYETALATVLTGRDATFGTWSEPEESERQKAHRILEQVGCADTAERRWDVLSQGERQRVLIARALMSDPALVLLDEPCSGLDPIARERFLAFVNELGGRESAPSLVLVTHHLEEITPAFSHALLLSGGRVVASGKKDDVLTSPLLSQTFGTDVTVIREGGRYSLRFLLSVDGATMVL